MPIFSTTPFNVMRTRHLSHGGALRRLALAIVLCYDVIVVRGSRCAYFFLFSLTLIIINNITVRAMTIVSIKLLGPKQGLEGGKG